MKLVVLDGYTLNPGDLDWSKIEALVDEFVLYPRTENSEISERIADADIILTIKLLSQMNTLMVLKN